MKTSVTKTLMGAALVAAAVVAVPGMAAPALAQGTQAAASPQRVQLSGSTSAGKPFTGFGQVQGVADQGRKVATVVVEIEGVGQQSFQVAVPEGHELTGLRIDERAPAKGARTFIDEIFGEASGPLDKTPTFEARAITRPAAAEEQEEQAEEEQAEEDDGFDVEIVKADGTALDPSEIFMLGDKIELKARPVQREGSKAPPAAADCQFVWSIPGKQIKDYSLDLDGVPNFYDGRPGQTDKARHHNTVKLTKTNLPAGPEGEMVSYYWASGAGQDVEITVKVTADRRRAEGQAKITVKMSEKPAEEIFTGGKVPGSFGKVVLLQHSNWHVVSQLKAGKTAVFFGEVEFVVPVRGRYNGGDRFIYFHREFLRVYEEWRKTFGYGSISSTIAFPDADRRSTRQSQLNAIVAGLATGNPDYKYLTIAGGKKSSNRHGAFKLGDFQSVQDFGDDLESPWHNTGHVRLSGVDKWIGGVGTAPRSDLFFQWHRQVDDVAKEYEAIPRTK